MDHHHPHPHPPPPSSTAHPPTSVDTLDRHEPSTSTPLMSRLSTTLSTGIMSTSTSSSTKVPSGLRKHPFFQALRSQLSDQLRSLELRLEGQLCVTGELAEYFRRRGEIETEIGKTLDKHHRKELNHKIGARRSEWVLPATLTQVMTHLVNETRKEAKERLVLGEICAHIAARLLAVNDDLQRVFKQCQSVCLEGQDELVQVLQELYAASKAHERYALELKQADAKLRAAEAQKNKIETALGKEKAEKSKKFRNVDKEVQKRTRKYGECRYSAAKAKNEYVLCMDAAEAAVHKYFVDDISDIIDCMDLGYYESVTTGLKLYVAGEEVVRDSVQNNIDQLGKLLVGLDTRVDKQKFIEQNNSFVMPKRVAFLHTDDQSLLMIPPPAPPPGQQQQQDTPPTTTTAATTVQQQLDLDLLPTLEEEMCERVSLLDRRLSSLRAESNELWKTLESAEGSLLTLIQSSDCADKAKDWFVGTSNKDIPSNVNLNKHKRTELEQYHINKYRDFMLSTNRLSRLQAKWERISRAVGDNKKYRRPSFANAAAESAQQPLVNRKRIGATSYFGQANSVTSASSSSSASSRRTVRLFGGSLQEYLDANRVHIPQVIKSAVRVLNLFGLHHQGIFRVSGSQVEINNFRDAFERGEDPLAHMNADNASDINSVAGLLKLYLRELREPLFPIVFFDVFMEIAKLEDSGLFVERLRDLLSKSLPRNVFGVTRYLFHFLNHLSEYSDENMMDPYNLAICFGPTLVPVPEDQVQYQNLVNELVKNVITHAKEVFPPVVGGGGGGEELYDPNGFNRGEDDDDNNAAAAVGRAASVVAAAGEEDDEEYYDEDEEENNKEEDSSSNQVRLEALAEYDFRARSSRELSFRKGQRLLLVGRVSTHWWRGHLIHHGNNNSDDSNNAAVVVGLIPDQYIAINNHQQNKERTRSLDRSSRTRKKSLSVAIPPPQSSLQDPNSSSPPIVVVPAGPSSAPTTSSTSLKATPDLVMDLPEKTPTTANSSAAAAVAATAAAAPPTAQDLSSPVEDSLQVEVESIAEVFGLESQCTLRKATPTNTKQSTNRAHPQESHHHHHQLIKEED